MERPPRLRAGRPRVSPRLVHDDNRGTTTERGYGAAWQKARRVALDADPLCKHCMKRGRITAAEQVDHIIPLRDGEVIIFRRPDSPYWHCRFKRQNKWERFSTKQVEQPPFRPDSVVVNRS